MNKKETIDHLNLNRMHYKLRLEITRDDITQFLLHADKAPKSLIETEKAIARTLAVIDQKLTALGAN